MTLGQALKKYSLVEIELLLAHILGKPREFLYMEPERKLTNIQIKRLAGLVKRREKGEPLAYILGYKDFCGLGFIVNQHVLIPRPETEGLVERIAHLGLGTMNRAKTFRILDAGTGSGCIAISIAKQLAVKASQLSITASDISFKALAVAKQNAKKHRVKIRFIYSDLFENIEGKFDVIVANLPYVPLKFLRRHLHHRGSLKPGDPFLGLKYEPAFALTDGTSSFQIYRRFFQEVKNHILASSTILLEIEPSARKFLVEYQKKYLPEWQIKFFRDFNGLRRFAEVFLK